MRNLPDVIQEMIGVIPKSEDIFINDLENNKSSAEYSSPETIMRRWECTAETLLIHLGEGPKFDGWKRKVVNIWMGREEK